MSYLNDLHAAHKARRDRFWPILPQQSKRMETNSIPDEIEKKDDGDELVRLRAENESLRHQLEKARWASADPLGSHGQERPVITTGPISINRIIHVVAAAYDVTRIDILSHRRTAKIVRPRQVAIYLAKRLTTRSYPSISRFIGDRDHTTAMASVRRVEQLMAEDTVFKNKVEELAGMLKCGHPLHAGE